MVLPNIIYATAQVVSWPICSPYLLNPLKVIGDEGYNVLGGVCAGGVLANATLVTCVNEATYCDENFALVGNEGFNIVYGDLSSETSLVPRVNETFFWTPLSYCIAGAFLGMETKTSKVPGSPFFSVTLPAGSFVGELDGAVETCNNIPAYENSNTTSDDYIPTTYPNGSWVYENITQ